MLGLAQNQIPVLKDRREADRSITKKLHESTDQEFYELKDQFAPEFSMDQSLSSDPLEASNS